MALLDFESVKKLLDEYAKSHQVYADENNAKHFKTEGVFALLKINTVKELYNNYSQYVEVMNKAIHSVADEIQKLSIAHPNKTSEPDERLYIVNSIQQAKEKPVFVLSNAKTDLLQIGTRTDWVNSSNLDYIRVLGTTVPLSRPTGKNFSAGHKGRCVFIPSKRRSTLGFLDYPYHALHPSVYKASEDHKLFAEQSTTFVVVVDSEEMEEYRRAVGKELFIIAKPPNYYGVGASRFWCQMFAEHFELEYCWMVDDSTSSVNLQDKNELPSMMDAFLLVENAVAYCNKEKNCQVAIAGIEKTGRPDTKVSRKYAGNMVLLNIEQLKKSKVYYRTELVDRKEDILFPYECHRAGLDVMKLSHLRVSDARWKYKTGNHTGCIPKHNSPLEKHSISIEKESQEEPIESTEGSSSGAM